MKINPIDDDPGSINAQELGTLLVAGLRGRIFGSVQAFVRSGTRGDQDPRFEASGKNLLMIPLPIGDVSGNFLFTRFSSICAWPDVLH